jgi:hypothetical protein
MKIHFTVREICELKEMVRNTTKEKKNQQRDKSAIWGKRTGRSRKMPFGKINDLIDVVNSLKFHVNSLSGCGAVNTQS